MGVHDSVTSLVLSTSEPMKRPVYLHDKFRGWAVEIRYPTEDDGLATKAMTFNLSSSQRLP